MNTSNRRGFIRNIAAGSVALGSGLVSRKAGSQEFNRVVYRELGSTGLKVSELGFGAMNTRNAELIQAAIDSGINYIDTAHGYMRGENEKIVGEVMKTNRDKVVLATKVHARGKSETELRGMIELSLSRLGVDHVDILFSHMPQTPADMLVDSHMKVFEKARQDGLCRWVGVSTHVNQADILNAAVENKSLFEAVLVGYNYSSPPEITPAIEKARKAGIAIIAMKTQLKGKGWPEHTMGENVTINQAALKWVLDNPYVDTTIPGMTAFEQLTEDLGVMGMKMSFEDRGTLRRYGQTLDKTYCRGVSGCTGCQDQCPNGVQICEINRCLGYAYGYGDMRLAYENYEMLPREARLDACEDCDECVVKCVNGLNLTENIRRARTIFG